MNKQRRVFLQLSVGAAVSTLSSGWALALDTKRSESFSSEERRIIENYYHKGKKSKKKGLPPGLAKRGGDLPPGLQKKLDRGGQLPPGLQKRLEPLPADLDHRLPRLPEHWERVVVERDIVLIDRRTNRILDIIEDVIDLVKGR
ncbi:MAG: hypothetical protein ACREPG_11565 [Candidatus Binatia bacterium]